MKKHVELLGSAKSIARAVHWRQVDKNGESYFYHLVAVVNNLRQRWPHAPQYAFDAAWLHDTFEDTWVTPFLLSCCGISQEAIDLVEWLTRRGEKSYLEWIADFARDAPLWAVKVKIADNQHNSDLRRRIPGSNLFEKRYEPARHILESALSLREMP